MFKVSILFILIFSAPVFSKEITVQMKNKGSNGEKMVFEPSLIRANPGDTINFVAKTSGHQVQSFKKGVPKKCSIQTKKGKKEKTVDCSKGKTKNILKSGSIKKGGTYSVTIKDKGFYAIMCKPHLAMGMVGLIVVGDPKNKKAFVENLRSNKKLKKKGLKRMKKLLTKI
jgi:plastocyanin